jgi:hypothetical protein
MLLSVISAGIQFLLIGFLGQIVNTHPEVTQRHKGTLLWGFMGASVLAFGFAIYSAYRTDQQSTAMEGDLSSIKQNNKEMKGAIDKLAAAANVKGDQSPAAIVKEAISLLPKAAIDVTSGTGNLSGNANTSSIGQIGGQTIGSGNQGINTIGQVGNNTILHGPHQRHLTAKQINDLKTAARRACGDDKYEVTAANSDREAQIYAMDFVNSLKKANCSSELALPIPGLLPTVTGIHIGIRPAPVTLDELKSNNPNAYFLSNALGKIGIHPEFSPLDSNFFAASKFVLVIGGEDPKDVER